MQSPKVNQEFIDKWRRFFYCPDGTVPPLVSVWGYLGYAIKQMLQEAGVKVEWDNDDSWRNAECPICKRVG